MHRCIPEGRSGRALCIAAAAIAMVAGPGPARGAPPQTVAQVDLARYAGRWYQVSYIPNRFQDQCARNTTATYALRTDGRLDVVNRCLRADGTPDEARGVARVVEPDSRARLEVSFVRFLWRQWFWGDYWVIGLDPDYRWAVVGTPTRKYGWVLARTPGLDEAAWRQVRTLLEEQGYDPGRFVESPHSRP